MSRKQLMARGVALALTTALFASSSMAAPKAVAPAQPVPAVQVQKESGASEVVVNVNKATKEELAEALPGVGQVKAEAIVEYREKNGPFKTLDDLEKVKGIGPAFIRDNKDKIGF